MKIDLTEFDNQFAKTNFAVRDEIVALFPEYKRLQLASRKSLPKGVKIEGFTMKTPFGDKVLLENADLIIEAGRRQSLVGPNCCGKTLLFHNIISGEIPDFPKHLHVHHCKELEPHELGDTVLNTVVTSNHFLNVLLRVESHIKKLKTEPGLDNMTLSNLTNNLDFVVSLINALDGYRATDKAAKMLKVLGFDEVGQKKLVSSLSGGLRMRVALCMAFFIEADLLLLDEPTNHLDFPSVLWLENRLRGYKGSFLMVSHDRELLKNVCMSVLLMEDQKIHYYHMAFDAFEKKKALEDKTKFEEIEKFLARNKNPSPTSPIGRMVLDKRNWYKHYHEKQVAMATKFTFPSSTPLTPAEGDTTPASEMTLINLENVRFSYDVSTGHFIFNDPISFKVTASTRVGVMGPNGAGKSTLLKLLTKKLIPTEGSLYTHPEYKLAYFGQHSTAELDLELTAFDFMVNSFPTATAANLRNHLGKTGIVGDVADTRMKGLSYSQRSCIVFSKLTYAGPHLLIMDEPTNFLDLESVDSLIGACNKYKGALLLVSHNRDFLKKCARQYLSVVPGQFLLYDDLKSAEKGTYSFISDLESGGKVGKDALQNTPGGGSVHASQKVGAAPVAAAPKTAASPASTPVGSAASTPVSSPLPSPLPSPASSPSSTPRGGADAALPFTVGQNVQAKFKDGKWYPAVVKGCKVNSVTITYSGYGNTETQALATVRVVKKSD